MKYVVTYETTGRKYEVPVKTEEGLGELQRVIQEYPQIQNVVVVHIVTEKEK